METAKCFFLEFVRNDRVAKKIIYGMVRGAPFVIESCEILSGDFSVIIGGEAPKHTTTSRKTCEVCFAGWLKKVSLGVECDTSTGSFFTSDD